MGSRKDRTVDSDNDDESDAEPSKFLYVKLFFITPFSCRILSNIHHLHDWNFFNFVGRKGAPQKLPRDRRKAGK